MVIWHDCAVPPNRILDYWKTHGQGFLAASLVLKKSPDPWLGLAPLYIYSLHDLAHGEAAIRQASRLGYATGKRETAELADLYRYRVYG